MSVTRSAQADKQLLEENGFLNGVDIKSGITGMITVFQYNGNDPAILPLCVDGYIMVKILRHAVDEPGSVVKQAEEARLSYFNECKILAALKGKGSGAHAAVVRLGNDESGQYEFIINKPIFSNKGGFSKKAAEIKAQFDDAVTNGEEKIEDLQSAINDTQTKIRLMEELKSVFDLIKTDRETRIKVKAALEFLKKFDVTSDALSDEVKRNLINLGIDNDSLGKYLIEILHREFDEDSDINPPVLSSGDMTRYLEDLINEASEECDELEAELQDYLNPGDRYSNSMQELLSDSFCNLEQCMRDMGNNGVDPRASFTHVFARLKEQLDNLHRDGVIHGDLAGRNAVVVLKGKGEKLRIDDAVLVDCGLSRTFANNKANIELCDNQPIRFQRTPAVTYDLVSVKDQAHVTPLTDDFAFKFMQVEAIALFCGESDVYQIFMRGLQTSAENAKQSKILKNNDNETRINNAVSNLEEKIKDLRASPDKDVRQRGEYAHALLNQCKAELLALPQELKDQKVVATSVATQGMFSPRHKQSDGKVEANVEHKPAPSK